MIIHSVIQSYHAALASQPSPPIPIPTTYPIHHACIHHSTIPTYQKKKRHSSPPQSKPLPLPLTLKKRSEDKKFV